MASAHTPAGAELRRIAALAWPVVLTSLNWTLLHLTDIVVLGAVGIGEVEAMGASRALTYVAIVIGWTWLTGVLVFVARADGAADLPATGVQFRAGILFALMLGAVVAAPLWLAALPLLRAVGVAADVAPAAARVVEVMALASPFQMVLAATSFFLEGVSRPRRVLAVNLVTLPVNAVLAWAWSGGHLGLPAWGAVGAAWATVTASALGAALMVAAAMRLPRADARALRTLALGPWRDSARLVPALARFGVVPAIASGLELGGFAILIALSTQLGPVPAHAFQIVFSVHNVTFALAMGVGSAAGVRVGNAVGAGEVHLVRFRTALAASLAGGATGLAALLLALAPVAVAGLFPADPAVTALSAEMLRGWAPFILFDGLQCVLIYALRSLGDQVRAGVNGIIAYFLVTGGLGHALVAAGLGPWALVWASGLGMAAAAALHGARLLQITRARPRS
jgi:MATE family multidrug resistance protein